MPVPKLTTPPMIQKPVEGGLASLMTPTAFEEVGGGNYISIPPNEPFFLRHHPANWRISAHLDTPCVLPEITIHILAPGVNGVRTRDKNEPVEAGYKNSVRAAQDVGWLYLDPAAPIPEDCLPPGVPAGGYLRDLDCRHPLTLVTGKRYVEAWNVPVVGLPDQDQQFKFQTPSYERWLRFLVESGQIALMNPQILEGLTTRVRGHLERAQTLNLSDSVRQIFVDRKQKIVDAYQNAKPLAAKMADAVAPDLGAAAVRDQMALVKAEVAREKDAEIAEAAGRAARAEIEAAQATADKEAMAEELATLRAAAATVPPEAKPKGKGKDT